MKGGAGLGAQRIGEGEVPTVRGIGVKAKAVLVSPGQQRRQRIDRANRGGAHRRDDGAHLFFRENPVQCPNVEAPLQVDGTGAKPESEHGADAPVGIVRLFGGDDGSTGAELPCDPEGFEIRHGAPAGQVAEVRGPAEHGRDRGDRLLLHRRAGAAPVEGMVVRVEAHRERVGEAGDQMRRLEHLSGVERMRIGEVIVQPVRDLEEDPFERRRIGREVVGHGKRGESLTESPDGPAEDGEGVGVESRGRGCRHGRYLTRRQPRDNAGGPVVFRGRQRPASAASDAPPPAEPPWPPCVRADPPATRSEPAPAPVGRDGSPRDR